MPQTRVPELRSWSLVAVAVFTVGGLIGVAPPAHAADCSPAETTVDGEAVYTFSTVGTCTWTVPADADLARLLIVAGGGAAGQDLTGKGAGGGGAGGVIQETSFALTPGSTVTVTVGAGATTLSGDGGDSVFDSLTATGGGGGGKGGGSGSDLDGRPGGSGGGAAVVSQYVTARTGGAGISGQGYAGGGGNGLGTGSSSWGGGGGGAGGVGDPVRYPDKTSGGPGITDDISGSSTTYAPGGGGGQANGITNRSAATAIGAGGNATLNDANSSGVDGIVIVRLVADADSGSSESSDEPSAVAEPESLELQTPDGVTCSSNSLGGSLGSWMTLPGRDDCSVADEPDLKVLGWATIEDFPVDIAQRQVDNGWGAYELFDDGQMTAVFIPAGGSTFMSDSNALYPVIGE